jgi:hypothetical protein
MNKLKFNKQGLYMIYRSNSSLDITMTLNGSSTITGVIHNLEQNTYIYYFLFTTTKFQDTNILSFKHSRNIFNTVKYQTQNISIGKDPNFKYYFLFSIPFKECDGLPFSPLSSITEEFIYFLDFLLMQPENNKYNNLNRLLEKLTALKYYYLSECKYSKNVIWNEKADLCALTNCIGKIKFTSLNKHRNYVLLLSCLDVFKFDILRHSDYLEDLVTSLEEVVEKKDFLKEYSSLNEQIGAGIKTVIKVSLLREKELWLDYFESVWFPQLVDKHDLYDDLVDCITRYSFTSYNTAFISKVKSLLFDYFRANENLRTRYIDLIKAVCTLLPAKEDIIRLLLCELSNGNENIFTINTFQFFKDKLEKCYWANAEKVQAFLIKQLTELFEKHMEKEYTDIIEEMLYGLIDSFTLFVAIYTELKESLNDEKLKEVLSRLKGLRQADYVVLIGIFNNCSALTRIKLLSDELKTKIIESVVHYPYSLDKDPALKNIMLYEYYFNYDTFIETTTNFINRNLNLTEIGWVLNLLLEKNNLTNQDFENLIFKLVDNQLIRFISSVQTLNTFLEIIKKLNDHAELAVSICKRLFDYLLNKYDLDKSILIIKSFNDNPHFKDNAFENNYITYLENLIANNDFDLNRCGRLLKEISYMGIIKSNCLSYDKFVNLLLKKLGNADINIFNNLLQKPEMDILVEKLFSAEGTNTTFINNILMVNLKAHLQGFAKSLLDSSILCSKVLKLSLLNGEQLISLHERLSIINKGNYFDCLNEIIDKYKNIQSSYQSVECFEYNFSSNLGDLDGHLANYKALNKNQENTQMKDYVVEDGLSELIKDFELINSWNETGMFKHLLKIKFEQKLNNVNNQINDDNIKPIENPVVEENINPKNNGPGDTSDVEAELINNELGSKMSTEKFILCSKEIIRNVKEKLPLQMSNYPPQMTLKALNYFRNLNDHKSEILKIKTLCGLSGYQLDNLCKTVSKVNNINSVLKFSQIMLDFNDKYPTAENNNELYLEIVEVLRLRLESMFFHIFESKLEQAELIKNEYVALNSDIEGVIEGFIQAEDMLKFINFYSENDIRNLIYAVDELSDSNIRQTDILELMKIDSFVKRLDIKGITEGNYSEEYIVYAIGNLLKDNAYKNLDVTIKLSIKKFGEIKSMFDNLSNREEACKVKTKNIMDSCYFTFIPDCENRKYNFGASYINSLGNQNELKFDDLQYLKERVSIIKTDNEIEQHEINESFKKAVDLIVEILNRLQDMIYNGYPDIFNQTIYIEERNLENLEIFYNHLNELNREWLEEREATFRVYYPLTYFNGPQIWEVEKLFKDCDMNCYGYNLLKSIFPNLTEQNIIDKRYVPSENFKERLRNVGQVVKDLLDESTYELLGVEHKDSASLKLKGTKIILSCPNVNEVYCSLLSINFYLSSSFPAASHILYCRSNTSYFELYSFLLKFLLCDVENRVFTILQPEELSFELQENIFTIINEIAKDKSIKSYLSIICYDTRNPFYGQLSENPNVFKNEYLMDGDLIKRNLEKFKTNIVTSSSTGAGKTHYIKKQFGNNHKYENFLISDTLDINDLAKRFYEFTKGLTEDNPIHITISGRIDDFRLLDYFLFNVLTLRNFTYDLFSSLAINNPIYIEVANSFNNELYKNIHILKFIPQSKNLNSRDELNNNLDIEYNTNNLQIVCNYLGAFTNGTLNNNDIKIEEINNMTKEQIMPLLETYFIREQVTTSFKQLNIFINILADQFEKFSQSHFYTVESLSEEDISTRPPTIRPKYVHLRSKIITALLILPREFIVRSIKEVEISQSKALGKIEEDGGDDDGFSSVRRWTSSNYVFLMFDEGGQYLNYIFKNLDDLPQGIGELAKRYDEFFDFDKENPSKFTHQKLLDKLLSIEKIRIISTEDTDSFKKNYKLTFDNFIKMILILTRARVKLPIVIMGETGCGKTSLIRFLTKVILNEDFEIINFHAGITKEYILSRMTTIIDKANLYLLNENTKNTRCWVFLDEINTCDCLGLIADIICQRSLQGKPLPENIVIVAACNPYRFRSKQDKGIGLIKQRTFNKLVYTVHAIPDTILDYVWDYGSLSNEDESIYIRSILSNLSGYKDEAIELVIKAQKFIRQEEGRYSVSLRDIERFRKLHEWFYEMLKVKNSDQYRNPRHNLSGIYHRNEHNLKMKSILLAMSICYYNRLSDTKQKDRFYNEVKSDLFNIENEDFKGMIRDEQMDILTRMELPPAIALNSAILENVFTLLVCALNKIPLFICGKPGCSKSLAVQLLISNMRGEFSSDNYFKTLPQIAPHVYQGSEASTSEGIKSIFQKAEKAHNDNNAVIQMVYFDEIGLAEISKNNPLKVLHSLLEPEDPKLAFVGISNWKLDASKMNRAIYLSRPNLDRVDLIESGISILSYYCKDRNKNSIIAVLAKTYFEFIEDYRDYECPDLYGTRDYYSLIKQIARNLNNLNSEGGNYGQKKQEIIRKCIQRNFGGTKSSANNFLQIYNNYSRADRIQRDTVSCTDLVVDNLKDTDARFMLIFTSGNSASYILDNHLEDKLDNRQILIGSEFEEDKDNEDYMFKILSDIVLYIESGRSLIMKNLDCVYGALYDLFNQNYTVLNDKKNCRISLGKTNNPMCYVNNNFHCIVLADMNKMKEMDPPFLNRFEKQLLTFDAILTDLQYTIMTELKQWIDNLTFINNENSIDLDQLIIGYDMGLEFLKSLIIYNTAYSNDKKAIIEKCKKDILLISNSNLLLLSTISEIDLREPGEITKIYDIYFSQQHESLNDYVNHHPSKTNNKLVVYTYSNYLSEIRLNSTYTIVCISELKTEKEFDKKLINEFNNNNDYILVKIDAASETNFISYVLFRITSLIKEFEYKTKKTFNINIALIIYLSRECESNQNLPNLFLSGWSQIVLEYINGADLASLYNFLTTPPREILSTYLFEKHIINDLLREDTYLKFNYLLNDKDEFHLIEDYKERVLDLFVKDEFIWNTFNNKILQMVDSKLDRKEIIKAFCFKNDMMNKSDNFGNRIKVLMENIIKFPLLQIMYQLESNSATESILTNSNKKLCEIVVNEFFKSKDIIDIKPYEALQSLNIQLIFDLKHPFSKKEMQDISNMTRHNIT